MKTGSDQSCVIRGKYDSGLQGYGQYVHGAGWGQRSDQQVCYEQSSLNVLHYCNDSSSDCSSCAKLHSSNDGSITTHNTLGAQYSIDFNTYHENNEDQQPDMCYYSVPYSSSVVQKHISEPNCCGLESLWLGLDRKKMTHFGLWS